MLSINIGLGMYTAAATDYNSAYKNPIDFNRSPAAAYFSDGTLTGDLEINESDAIPESSDSIDPETGNIFTDTFKTFTNWLSDKQTKLSIVSSVLSQPKGFMIEMGVPKIYANAFGLLWYIIILLLFISFLKGGAIN